MRWPVMASKLVADDEHPQQQTFAPPDLFDPAVPHELVDAHSRQHQELANDRDRDDCGLVFERLMGFLLIDVPNVEPRLTAFGAVIRGYSHVRSKAHR